MGKESTGSLGSNLDSTTVGCDSREVIEAPWTQWSHRSLGSDEADLKAMVSVTLQGEQSLSK